MKRRNFLSYVFDEFGSDAGVFIRIPDDSYFLRDLVITFTYLFPKQGRFPKETGVPPRCLLMA